MRHRFTIPRPTQPSCGLPATQHRPDAPTVAWPPTELVERRRAARTRDELQRRRSPRSRQQAIEPAQAWIGPDRWRNSSSVVVPRDHAARSAAQIDLEPVAEPRPMTRARPPGPADRPTNAESRWLATTPAASACRASTIVAAPVYESRKHLLQAGADVCRTRRTAARSPAGRTCVALGPSRRGAERGETIGEAGAMPWRGPASAAFSALVWDGSPVAGRATAHQTEAYDTSACSPTNVILEHGQGLLALTVTDLGE